MAKPLSFERHVTLLTDLFDMADEELYCDGHVAALRDIDKRTRTQANTVLELENGIYLPMILLNPGTRRVFAGLHGALICIVDTYGVMMTDLRVHLTDELRIRNGDPLLYLAKYHNNHLRRDTESVTPLRMILVEVTILDKYVLTHRKAAWVNWMAQQGIRHFWSSTHLSRLSQQKRCMAQLQNILCYYYPSLCLNAIFLSPNISSNTSRSPRQRHRRETRAILYEFLSIVGLVDTNLTLWIIFLALATPENELIQIYAPSVAIFVLHNPDFLGLTLALLAASDLVAETAHFLAAIADHEIASVNRLEDTHITTIESYLIQRFDDDIWYKAFGMALSSVAINSSILCGRFLMRFKASVDVVVQDLPSFNKII